MQTGFGVPGNVWQWMERWQAACIWLLLAIPAQYSDITSCAYFMRYLFFIFLAEIFYAPFLFFFSFFFYYTAIVSQVNFKLVQTRSDQWLSSESICCWVSTTIVAERYYISWPWFNEKQTSACCIMSEISFYEVNEDIAVIQTHWINMFQCTTEINTAFNNFLSQLILAALKKLQFPGFSFPTLKYV